jgi:hypothetical protein
MKAIWLQTGDALFDGLQVATTDILSIVVSDKTVIAVEAPFKQLTARYITLVVMLPWAVGIAARRSPQSFGAPSCVHPAPRMASQILECPALLLRTKILGESCSRPGVRLRH